MGEDWKDVDSTVYQFSHLPVVGSGEKYRVSVQSVFTSVSGQVTRSQPVSEICFTKPLPPRDLKVLDHEKQIISWQKSQSPSVRVYKVKIKKDSEKAQDFLYEVEENQNECIFHIPKLDPIVEYKLHIHSVLMHGDQQVVESDSLFYRIRKEDTCSITAETDSSPFDYTDSQRKFKLCLLGRERDSVQAGVGPVPEPGLISRQTSTDMAV